MRYVSTRAGVSPVPTYSFQEAVEGGYAPDGGLFVPESFPDEWMTEEKLRELLLRFHCFIATRGNRNTVDGSAVTDTDMPGTPLDYATLAFELFRLFIPQEEMCDTHLRQLCRDSFAVFDHDGESTPGQQDLTVSLVEVPNRRCHGDSHPSSFYIAELFNGPTMCFKDLGLGFLVRILRYFCAKGGDNRRRTIVVATTGDTGPAAARAVVDSVGQEYAMGLSSAPTQKNGFNIVVAHPKGQISDFQRKQMTTVRSDSVKTVLFEGGGDDLDGPIKVLQTEPEFKGKYGITGANSYNIARPIAQIVHYVWSWLVWVYHVHGQDLFVPATSPDAKVTLRDDVVLKDKLVQFFVPTGAMGNVTAGLFALRLGLPIERLNCSSNINDITYRVFSSGDFVRQNNEADQRDDDATQSKVAADEQILMRKNYAEAMNVLVPYNFERILHYYLMRDLRHKEKTDAVTAAQVAEHHRQAGIWMRSLQAGFQTDSNGFQVPPAVLADMRQVFGHTSRVTDPEIEDMVTKYATTTTTTTGGGAERKDTGTGIIPYRESYLLCPHTAVAIRSAEEWSTAVAAPSPSSTNNIIILATAHWSKFEGSLRHILNADPCSIPTAVSSSSSNSSSTAGTHAEDPVYLRTLAVKELPERAYDLILTLRGECESAEGAEPEKESFPRTQERWTQALKDFIVTEL